MYPLDPNHKTFDALLIDVGVEQSQIDLVAKDGLLEMLQKFLHLGDDRNITGVWVQGRRAKGS
jgi:guanine deaminase